MSPGLVAFFVVAAVLRLGSLFVSIRNEARLRAEGAEEFGAGNSRLMASLHALFYVGAFTESWWRESQIGPWAWLGFALYGGAMLVLLHVVRELGRLWTVKVLVAKRHTLNQSWLFRAVRHPNYYLNIVPELVGLALAMGAWSTLIFLLPCYLLALFRRIRIEEEVMRERFPAYR